ncbi:MAG: PAC2 family protein [Candidatus Diapherotrites archaeon]|nr:PAC2 family protein [Candidatus Diapherotrites archaeon]
MEITFHNKVKSKNALMVVGLPGVGFVGQLAVEYIVSELKPKKIATIHSKGFPPQVFTKPDGEIEVLDNRLYLLKRKGKRDIYFLHGNAQPGLPPQGAFDAQHIYSSDIVKLAKSQGVSEIYTLAGISDINRISQGSKIIAVATDKKIFKKIKGKFDRNIIGFPINGAAGLILQYAKFDKMEGVCFISTTGPQPVVPDFGAAQEILNLLSGTLSLKINMKEIDKKAKEMEKRLKEAIAAPSEEASQFVMASEQGREKYPSYIR